MSPFEFLTMGGIVALALIIGEIGGMIVAVIYFRQERRDR